MGFAVRGYERELLYMHPRVLLDEEGQLVSFGTQDWSVHAALTGTAGGLARTGAKPQTVFFQMPSAQPAGEGARGPVRR